MSDKAPTLLKTASSIFEPQNIMAFIGNSGSGKTVVGTLLKDAIYSHFIKQHEDQFGFNLIKGSDILEETEEYIFDKKVFPPETDPGTQSELKFEITRKGPMGGKIITQIRDLSGEDFKKVFLGDDLLPSVRVNNILTDKEKTESYGPLSFLIFAKLYVIVLDCAEFSHWRNMDTRHAQLLNSILGFKKVLGETENDEFSTPIAVILTKTDTLKNGIEGSAEEMVKNNLKQFYHTLNLIHKGEHKFFAMFIDSEKPIISQSDIPNVDQTAIDPTSDDTVSEIDLIPLKKLKDPIHYSDAEYVKFILWFLETLS